MPKFPTGVAPYRIDGEKVWAEYVGRERGFECCVCRKGSNAYCFNILHGRTKKEALAAYKRGDYETWGFGPDHLTGHVEVLEGTAHEEKSC